MKQLNCSFGLWLAAVVFATGSSISVPLGLSPASEGTEMTAEQRKRNLESFEVVWQTIRDKHWDPKLGGLDWQAVHDQLKPKVESAANMAEARAAMSAMLDRLGQTHFGIMPSDVYGDVDSESSGEATPGADVRVVDGRVLVTSVDP